MATNPARIGFHRHEVHSLLEQLHRSHCAACQGELRPSMVVEGFRYLRCRRCGTLNLDNAPSAAALAKLYQRDDTWTSAKDAGLDDPGAQNRDTRLRLKLLREMGANLQRVFELGSGLGYLARALVDQGSHVTAFELHGGANERLRSYGVTVVNDIAQANGEYDTIVLWGVIEHLQDPFATLSSLQHRVAPGGSIVILTEDNAAFLARLSGARWTWLLPPEHIVLFSRHGLSLCLARLGFGLAACRRWPANVRAIVSTALGRERGLKLRRWFRDTRLAADHGRGPHGLVGMVKRILDTTLWPLSEHKVYRFTRTSDFPSAPRIAERRERLDAAIYFAGTVFQRLSLFLALPLLLRSLSAAEYGTFGLLQSAVNLLPAILTLNLPATVTRLFFDGATEAERQTIATKLTVLSGAFGLLASSIVWLYANGHSRETASLLGVPEAQATLAITLVLVGALGSNHLQVAWGLWRAQNRALQTAIAISLNGLFFLAGVAVLAATHRLGAVTAIGAYACATAVVGITANGLALRASPVSGGKSYVVLAREALRYGLPVLPYLFAIWGLGAGGRWIARATLSLEDTGNFTLASQLAIMIGLVGRSAYDAWAPRSFAMFADGRLVEARRYLHTRARLTLAVVAALGVVTAVGFALLLPRFAPSYHRVASLIPIVALAPLFDVAHMSYHTELMGLKVTRPIATYTVATLLLFVVLGVAGAQLLGLWGLTGAYVLAYAAQWILAARAVRQVRRASRLARVGADALNDIDNSLWR